MRWMNRKAVAVAMLGSLTLAGASFARGPGEGRKLSPELLQKYDANKNGQLEDAEREAMRAERQKLREEKRAQFDANKDGQLDDTERQAMRQAFVAERFKALDTDGNGVLSLEEFQAGKGHERHGRHGRR